MLAVESPSKILPWLEQLNQAASVSTLRDTLKTTYPLLEPAQLKQLIIVGAADEGERLVGLCESLGIEVIAIADDNPERQETTLGGCAVVPTDTLSALDKQVPVIVASHRALKTFLRLREMGFKTVALFAVLQALDPVRFPPHMFYENWLESIFEHRDQVNALADLLEDELSLKTLDALIAFRFTLNPDQLTPIIDWDVYNPKGLNFLSDHEVYLDGGAYDGDTIRLFIERVNNRFDRVLAFEPDTNTHERLKKNFAHEPRVEPIDKGLYSHSTTLHFDNAGTRASIFSETAETGLSLPVTSIDEILKGERATYIKMNIEGAEIPALQGAKETIARYAPKLGISVYHRATDLWEIPFLIKALHDDYHFYLRQHDGGVIETVIYAVAP